MVKSGTLVSATAQQRECVKEASGNNKIKVKNANSNNMFYQSLKKKNNRKFLNKCGVINWGGEPAQRHR